MLPPDLMVIPCVQRAHYAVWRVLADICESGLLMRVLWVATDRMEETCACRSSGARVLGTTFLGLDLEHPTGRGRSITARRT